MAYWYEEDRLVEIFQDPQRTKNYFSRAAHESDGKALTELVLDLKRFARGYGVGKTVDLISSLEKMDKNRVLQKKEMRELVLGLKCFWTKNYPQDLKKPSTQPSNVIDLALSKFPACDPSENRKVAGCMKNALRYELRKDGADLDRVGDRLDLLSRKIGNIGNINVSEKDQEAVKSLAEAGMDYLDSCLDILAPQTRKRFGGLSLGKKDVSGFLDRVEGFLWCSETEDALGKGDLLLKTYVVLANGDYPSVSRHASSNCCYDPYPFRQYAKHLFKNRELQPIPFLLRSFGIAPKFEVPSA